MFTTKRQVSLRVQVTEHLLFIRIGWTLMERETVLDLAKQGMPVVILENAAKLSTFQSDVSNKRQQAFRHHERDESIAECKKKQLSMIKK